jgi:hypothetical protein
VQLGRSLGAASRSICNAGAYVLNPSTTTTSTHATPYYYYFVIAKPYLHSRLLHIRQLFLQLHMPLLLLLQLLACSLQLTARSAGRGLLRAGAERGCGRGGRQGQAEGGGMQRTE